MVLHIKTFYICVCVGVYSPTTLKKCSALIENLIPKVLYLYCGGLLIKTPPFFNFLMQI